MPADLPGDGGFEGCVEYMMDEEGHDEAAAESICGALEEERKSDNGDPEGLLEALRQGSGLIADVGVDLVSAVDVPAIDSEWVMFKSDSDGHDYQVNSPILIDKSDDTEKRIAYAAAMVPREPDKEGDVAPTPRVEKAAHNFLKSDGGHDTDHSLIDGEGETVESWVLKEARTFTLPDGREKSYPEGTWMLGIEWAKDAWQRIQDGELTGLSIYGMAEHVPLSRAARCVECGKELSATNRQSGDTHKGEGVDSADMGDDQSTDDADADADGGGDDGPDIGEVAASVESLSESVADVTETVESVKEAIETDKQDAQEAAAELGDEYDVRPGDVLDILDAAAGKDMSEVLDAVESVEASMDSQEENKADDEDEEDGEDEQESSVDKRADDANLGKGGSGQSTAAKGIDADSDSGTGLSYAALAEEGD